MVRPRLCARPGCGQPSAATLVFQYATRTVSLLDLREPEPCTIDLCERHADRLTAPRGWTGEDLRAKAQVVAPPVVDRSAPPLFRAQAS